MRLERVWGLGVAFVLSGLAICASCAETQTGPIAETPPADDIPAPPGGKGWAPGRAGFPAQRASAQAQIAEATRGLEVAGTACGDACPLLLMYRVGVDRLCSVTETKDDEKVCKDNRKSLKDSEGKLSPSCGTCVPKPENPDASDYSGPAL